MLNNKSDNTTNLTSKSFKSHIERIISDWGAEECSIYLKEYSKDDSLEWVTEKVIKQALQIAASTSDGNERKIALKNVDKPLEYFLEYAPEKAKDTFVEEIKPNDDEKRKLKKQFRKNTGIYLWKNGYDVKKFIGKGGYGVVWWCGGDVVMKVVMNNDAFEAEKKIVQDLKNAVRLSETGNDNLEKKFRKYFNLGSLQENVKNVMFLKKAECGLDKLIKNEGKDIKDEKSFSFILRSCKQALKAVNLLHELGYSHNDVKPENFLRVKNDKVNKKHKYRIQLADMGLVSKIEGENRERVGTKGYKAPDVKNLDTSAVAKRDVYSLGATFLKIWDLYQTATLIKFIYIYQVIKLRDGDTIDSYKLSLNPDKIGNFIQSIYEGIEIFESWDEKLQKKVKKELQMENLKNKDIKKMRKFTLLIKDMLVQDYASRLSVYEALKRIKDI